MKKKVLVFVAQDTRIRSTWYKYWEALRMLAEQSAAFQIYLFINFVFMRYDLKFEFHGLRSGNISVSKIRRPVYPWILDNGRVS